MDNNFRFVSKERRERRGEEREREREREERETERDRERERERERGRTYVFFYSYNSIENYRSVSTFHVEQAVAERVNPQSSRSKDTAQTACCASSTGRHFDILQVLHSFPTDKAKRPRPSNPFSVSRAASVSFFFFFFFFSLSQPQYLMAILCVGVCVAIRALRWDSAVCVFRMFNDSFCKRRLISMRFCKRRLISLGKKERKIFVSISLEELVGNERDNFGDHNYILKWLVTLLLYTMYASLVCNANEIEIVYLFFFLYTRPSKVSLPSLTSFARNASSSAIVLSYTGSRTNILSMLCIFSRGKDSKFVTIPMT